MDADDDPMFVIKNLDTGLEMKIDDFDRLASIVTDEGKDPGAKSRLHTRTKAIKKWTEKQAKKATASAKKAVQEIKEAAHELNRPGLLAKNKLAQSIDGGSSKAGANDIASAVGLTDLLARRSTAESTGTPDRQWSGSLASVSIDEHSPSSSRKTLQVAADSNALTAQAFGVQPAAAPGSISAAAAASSVLVPPTTTAAAASAAAASLSSSVTAATVAAAQPVGPSVPAVVRLVSHKRSAKQVEEVVLAQVLEGCCGVVWALAFSRDGSFLAAGGQDGVLRVWQSTASRHREPRTNWVYSPTEDTKQSSTESSLHPDQAIQQHHEHDSDIQQPHSPHSANAGQQRQQQRQDAAETPVQQQQPQTADLPPLQQQQQQRQQQQYKQPLGLAPRPPPSVQFGVYFSQQPVRVYLGHTEDIIDVSWSTGGFILTASVDKAVRLWHVSQPSCLRVFWHADFVTSVQFHPVDVQRFVSGSVDGKLCVWSVMDSTVLASTQLHQDMVTAVAFSLNGGRVMAGTMRGRCRFYDLLDCQLEYVAQVDVRNQRGQHASGRKVTGICAVPGEPQQFLVTTNDSRLRLLEGYGQVLKFKGHKNASTQIRAGLSFDGAMVSCGSDDGWVYTWHRTVGPGISSSSSGSAGQAPAQHRGAADRQKAASAVQQMQALAGKNAVYQAYQADEAGLPVTVLAFAPASACPGNRQSVLMQNKSRIEAASQDSSSDGGSNLQEDSSSGLQPANDAIGSDIMLSRQLVGAGRLVQQLVVSAGFTGAIRVHELLGTAAARLPAWGEQ